MTSDEPDLRRLRLVFALEKLSPALRADVLADGTIAARLDVAAKYPAQLFETITVLRDKLLMAFRDAADGVTPSPLTDINGCSIDAKIWIDPNGSGMVEIGRKRLRVAQAGLLASDPARRLAYLETALRLYPLTQRNADYLRTVVVRPEYGEDDFFSAVMLLASSPQTFVEALQEKLRNQTTQHSIGPEDVLPQDVRHWEHLATPVDQSVTLSDYIDHELQTERAAKLELNASRAFYPMSVTFPAPSLVPLSLLRGLDAETVFDMVVAVGNVEDHFALVGAFEVCVDWVKRDSRFVSLGDRILERLFADIDRLAAACGMFAAIFVVATAHLAKHETLRRQPIYWRRLAAASHASLVVRICGTSGIKPDDIVAWAMRVAGETYLMSVVSELSVEPQWRPEWIVPNMLLADAAGRALGAARRLAEKTTVPEGWNVRLDAVQTWINENKLSLFLTYPAVLEGTRRTRQPTLAEFEASSFTAAVCAYRDLAEDPSVENLLVVTPLIAAFGFPVEARAHVNKSLDLIRNQGGDTDELRLLHALSVLAHISTLTSDLALADGVAEACMQRARVVKDPNRMFEVVSRLVECCAAIADEDAARTTLARRLEVLAVALPSSDGIFGLISAMEVLIRIQPLLAPLLGRAFAAARLALPRSTAA